jgi:hypothetical protein
MQLFVGQMLAPLGKQVLLPDMGAILKMVLGALSIHSFKKVL